jgi:serine O-acetyltransferase
MKSLVDALLASYKETAASIPLGENNPPSQGEVVEIVERLRVLLFPGYFGKKKLAPEMLPYHAGALLEEVSYHLEKQVARALRHTEEFRLASESAVASHAVGCVSAFLRKLPEIRALLALDVEASLDGDPAAYSKGEIISSYPGICAIAVSRLAHELHLMGIPLIPRIMTEYAHSHTGIDIHPGASLGESLFIDHGTGIVIGETTVIGKRVKIYQGVTLGALSTRGGQSLKGAKRHPTIEDDVTIYAGASILGGSTVIGAGSVVGGNAFITASLPPRTRVSVKNQEQCLVGEAFWTYEI